MPKNPSKTRDDIHGENSSVFPRGPFGMFGTHLIPKKLIAKYLQKTNPVLNISMLIFREYIYIHGHDDRGGGTTNKNTLQAFGFRWPQGKADLHDKDGEDQPISTRLQLGGTRKLSQLGRQNFPKDSTQILVMG